MATSILVKAILHEHFLTNFHLFDRLKMGSTDATKMVVSLIFLVILGSNLIAGQTFSSNSSEPGTYVLDVDNVSQPMIQSDDTASLSIIILAFIDVIPKDFLQSCSMASTIFTGVYGYVIGVIWLLGGIAYGGFLLATAFCCKTRRTASGLVLGGNAKFHSRAKTAVDIIIDTANDAWKTMYNTTGAMKDMKENLGVSNLRAAARASTFLTTTSEKLDAEASDIQRQARKNRRLIEKGLKIVYIVTTVTISLNLAALIALSGMSPYVSNSLVLPHLEFRCSIQLLSPVKSELDRKSSSLWSSEVTATTLHINCCVLDPDCTMLVILWAVFLLRKVNANLSTIQGVPYTVCNPFSAPPEYQYQPDKCPANTIRISEIPQVLKVLTCSSFDNGTCANGQFISPIYYRTVEAFSTSIQGLLNVYPEMENLVECQTVKDAFSEILLYHCKPLKRYVRTVWASMVFLSLVMVFLVLIWTLLAQLEQEHHSLEGSVKPHLSFVAEELETGSEHTVSAKEAATFNLGYCIKFWKIKGASQLPRT
ncbi:hypothetical protein DKX38_011979 [Salix brachista]|uniref:Uncharacterized protein n=1 Tax=Salix brachista TaxID=2182728 RepID=A0A5N5M2X5_9ROSI|nr:hypothetical protein DKX38_011979 [Salix brachista]